MVKEFGLENFTVNVLKVVKKAKGEFFQGLSLLPFTSFNLQAYFKLFFVFFFWTHHQLRDWFGGPQYAQRPHCLQLFNSKQAYCKF